MLHNPRTLQIYIIVMNELFKREILQPSINLQEFSLLNTNVIVDQIKKAPLFCEIKTKSEVINRPLSEGTGQKYAAAFISFTGFLVRRTDGVIRKALPSKEGHNKTFYRIRDYVKTNAFEDRADWEKFLSELYDISPRDCLIAKIML